MPQSCENILTSASLYLTQLQGHIFDLIEVFPPQNRESTIQLTKIISKLSPLLGNMIEFSTVDFLNSQEEYRELGIWKRQDPGFPDAIFSSAEITPVPGFEIKAWFPLSTEITARFKDSQQFFINNNTNVCILAWLPEHIIFGRPKIIDICVVSGKSISKARDQHYHNPPDYIILEPEDTTERTQNLQQTNTNGYKWQGSPTQLDDANQLVESWGNDARQYSPIPQYQYKMRQLLQRYPYRIDTNYAKIDRIQHEEIERFKQRVLDTVIYSMTIKQWTKLFNNGSPESIYNTLDNLIL
ncbi:hypothetical protein [Desulfovibrio piger]|uniref:hypothetical protein n=1 Tax=Desulfovibrio piger TaxID=901 RepID=UPI002665B79D|nr:hypothetical protein [Desulfovibrio piger]